MDRACLPGDEELQGRRGVCEMLRNGWLLFLVLLCVAFLVSCGKSGTTEIENGELVKVETEWET